MSDLVFGTKKSIWETFSDQNMPQSQASNVALRDAHAMFTATVDALRKFCCNLNNAIYDSEYNYNNREPAGIITEYSLKVYKFDTPVDVPGKEMLTSGQAVVMRGPIDVKSPDGSDQRLFISCVVPECNGPQGSGIEAGRIYCSMRRFTWPDIPVSHDFCSIVTPESFSEVNPDTNIVIKALAAHILTVMSDDSAHSVINQVLVNSVAGENDPELSVPIPGNLA